MSDLEQLVSGVRSAVSEARWPDPARLRARGDRRRARQRIAAVAGVVAAVLAVGAAVALGPGARHPQPPSGTGTPAPTASGPTSPAPTGSATTAGAPSILRQGSIEHTGDPRSMAVGQGSVWLGFAAPPIQSPGDSPGPGELVRLDAQSLKVTDHWSIAGSPEALVVTDHYVWVAGTAFDGRPPALDANHVQQFDLHGKLLHNYPVDTPTLLAAQGDSVWVEYGSPNVPAYLGHLHDGVADTPLRLGGANTMHPVQGGLVACPDGVYAASADESARSTVVDRVAGGRSEAQVKLPVLGLTALGCGSGQGVIAVTPDPSGTDVRQLFVDGRDQGRTLDAAGLSRALGYSAAGLWLGQADTAGTGTRVWIVDRGALSQGGPLTVPGDVPLAAADDRTLWTLGSDPRGSTTSWTVTAVAAS
jgi:hypothetical protein